MSECCSFECFGSLVIKGTLFHFYNARRDRNGGFSKCSRWAVRPNDLVVKCKEDTVMCYSHTSSRKTNQCSM